MFVRNFACWNKSNIGGNSRASHLKCEVGLVSVSLNELNSARQEVPRMDPTNRYLVEIFAQLLELRPFGDLHEAVDIVSDAQVRPHSV